MPRKFTYAAGLIFILMIPLQASEGFVSVKSRYSVKESLDRLVKILEDRGMSIVLRVNHTLAAERVGMELPPTELLVFGNPQIGTQLMSSSRHIAIDLPLKALAWEDDAGQVWISYNDPVFLAERHGIQDRDDVVSRVQKALAMFVKQAAEE